MRCRFDQSTAARQSRLGPFVLCLSRRLFVLSTNADPDNPSDHGQAPGEVLGSVTLFHLMRDGKDHDLVRACSLEQRVFVAEFLAYLIDQYSAELDECTYSDDMLKAYD